MASGGRPLDPLDVDGSLRLGVYDTDGSVLSLLLWLKLTSGGAHGVAERVRRRVVSVAGRRAEAWWATSLGLTERDGLVSRRGEATVSRGRGRGRWHVGTSGGQRGGGSHIGGSGKAVGTDGR